MLALFAAAAAPARADDATLRKQSSLLFGQISAVEASAVESAQAVLGRALFWDARISGNGSMSCASCHGAKDWSSDARSRPIDAAGKPTSRHSQPIFNSTLQPNLRWTGDRADAIAQAKGSVTGSLGFGSHEAAQIRLQDLQYLTAFKSAFPSDPKPISVENYARAIAAYEATLTTPAPFDKFLAGNDNALDAQQKRGLSSFIANGCVACHGGPLFGGTSLQKFGVLRPYWEATGSKERDEGLFKSTGKESDRYVFRVPMLRNIEKTAPYFHDGSVATLPDAIRVMADVQLGRKLPNADIADIARFLASLTGAVPTHYAPPATQNHAINK